MFNNKKLIAIAAVAIDGTIGIDGEIPWYLPEDLKHFRKTTIKKTLVIGFKTYLALPTQAFEKRNYVIIDKETDEIIISNNDDGYHFYFYRTIPNLSNIEEFYIAGGEKIFNEFLPYCDEAIITWVDKKYQEKTKKFPLTELFTNFETNENPDWKFSESGLRYRIVNYKRKIDDNVSL